VNRVLRAVLAAAVLPLIATGTLLAARPAMAASLTQVTNFGNNPSNLGMYIYVPDRLAARPALLVLVHYCGGTASGGALGAGVTTEFGFLGTWTGTNQAPTLTCTAS
jgi:poly(3-hydroxybutyrate) depolymerase